MWTSIMHSVIWLIFIRKIFHTVENILHKIQIKKSTHLVAVWLFRYLLPWVANSCSIYPLDQSLVPETLHVVSRYFLQTITAAKAELFLRSDVDILLQKLILCFFSQAFIDWKVINIVHMRDSISMHARAARLDPAECLT